MRLPILAPAFLVACAQFACSSPTTPTTRSAQENLTVDNSDRFIAYDNPYGDGRANPLANTKAFVTFVTISDEDAAAWNIPAETRVQLRAFGLPANTTFPAHVHLLPCAPPDKGGGHYQNVPGGPADETNEVHLDFTSDDSGSAVSNADAPFAIRAGGAHAVIIHDETADAQGKFTKLGCIDVDF